MRSRADRARDGFRGVSRFDGVAAEADGVSGAGLRCETVFPALFGAAFPDSVLSGCALRHPAASRAVASSPSSRVVHVVLAVMKHS
ncbi:MAG: hypothetical protein ACRDO0_15955 [Nocardioidaceae bacterium]